MTGRTYGLIEKYMMDDAEEAIVIIGSSAGTAKEAINELRAQGQEGGPHQGPLLPPLPQRGDRGGAEEREGLRRDGQGRQLQRPLRPHVRGGCAPACTPPASAALRASTTSTAWAAGTCGWRASSTCSRSWRRSPPPARWARPTATWMSGNKEGDQVMSIQSEREPDERGAPGRRPPDVRGLRLSHRGADGAAGPGARRTRRWCAPPPAAWRCPPSCTPTRRGRTASSTTPLRTPAATLSGVETAYQAHEEAGQAGRHLQVHRLRRRRRHL